MTKTRKFEEIPLDLIVSNNDQPRKQFNQEKIDELAESLKTDGVLQPIIVRPATEKEGFFQIVIGGRRYRAAERAKLKTIPALIVNLDELESYKIALIENVQREDLTIFEEAIAILHLMKNGGFSSPETLAKHLGKGVPFVRDRLKILQLPESIQKKLATEQISLSHAVALTKLKNAKQQEQVAEVITAEALTGEETQALILGKVVKLQRNLKIGDVLSPIKVLERLHALLSVLANSEWPKMEGETKVAILELFDELAADFSQAAKNIRRDRSQDSGEKLASTSKSTVGKTYESFSLLMYIEETERRIRNLQLAEHEEKYRNPIVSTMHTLEETLSARLSHIDEQARHPKKTK